MKILYVIPYFYPACGFGGTPVIAYQMARQMAVRGHNVVVYTTDANDLHSRLKKTTNETVGDIRVRYFRNLLLLSVRLAKVFVTPQLVSVASREVPTFDVIHMHEYRTFQNLVLRHCGSKRGIPYVLQPHGSLPSNLGKRSLKRAYDVLFGRALVRDASKLIAISRMEKEQFRRLGISEDKISIVPNGIDLTEYTDLPQEGAFRKKHDLDQGDMIVLYLGRIHWIKGVDTLLRSFALVARRLADAKLVLAGPDDGYLPQVKLLSRSLGIDSRVVIVGPLQGNDRLEALVDSNVCVLPSRYEAFGMTVLEAYACGRPVIASKVGAIPDIVLDGRTGLLYEAEDTDKLSLALLSLLEDPREAERMGHEARAFVKHFSIDQTTDRLESIYMALSAIS